MPVHQLCTLSFTDKNRYLLRGAKESVYQAHSEILEILLKSQTKEKRRKQDHVTRGTVEFAQFMAAEDPMVPTYWTSYKEYLSLGDLISNFEEVGKFDKIPLDDHSRMYSTIVKLVNETFDVSIKGQGKDAVGLERLRYNKLWVTKIQRIENPLLWKEYAHERQKMFLKLTKTKKGHWNSIDQLRNSTGPLKTEKYLSKSMSFDLLSEINECFLFHGTKTDTVKAICNRGLDPRLGSQNAMFGRGIYGAEMASKADQYTGILLCHFVSGKK